jgi:hypothetical protein
MTADMRARSVFVSALKNDDDSRNVNTVRIDRKYLQKEDTDLK